MFASVLKNKKYKCNIFSIVMPYLIKHILRTCYEQIAEAFDSPAPCVGGFNWLNDLLY